MWSVRSKRGRLSRIPVCSLLILWGSVSIGRSQQPQFRSGATGQEGQADATLLSQPEPDAQNDALSEGTGIPGVFPTIFQRHLLGRVSIGETYDARIQRRDHAGQGDTFTSLSASMAYDWNKKHSDYSFDYNVSGRHYNRFHDMDRITHDLGLSHSRQFSSRLLWDARYRFSLSPDHRGGLLQEDLGRRLLFINPLPTSASLPASGSSGAGGQVLNSGVNSSLFSGVATLPVPEEIVSPDGIADQLATLRSNWMNHSATSGLSYALSDRSAFFFNGGYGRTRYDDDRQFGRNRYSATAGVTHLLSARTSLFLNAGLSRMRYQDDVFLGTDNYRAAAGLSHTLTARTNVGVSYSGGRNELFRQSQRILSHSATASLNRQLTANIFVRVAGGALWIVRQGQEAISLSPVLANLLGRSALYQDASRLMLSWNGSAGLGTSWRLLSLDFQYDRSAVGASGVGSAAIRQRYSASVKSQLSRRTSLSLTGLYARSDFLGVRDGLRLDQQALRGTLTRELIAGLDVMAFVNYATLRAGSQGPFLLDPRQFGIRFVYHFPRLGRS